MPKYPTLFFTGGTLYSVLEIIWRKRTHISMFVAGGLALALIEAICNNRLSQKSLLHKCLAGSSIITSLELMIGYLVNIRLKLKVWNYSLLPFNFKGQICLLFSLFWFFLTIPALYICNFIKKKLCSA